MTSPVFPDVLETLLRRLDPERGCQIDGTKKFFKNADFACGKRCNSNYHYRLHIPRDPWDTAGHRTKKFFFKNDDFGPDRCRNPNPCYRLRVPRTPWDTLGH
jgi:hypothetical protein